MNKSRVAVFHGKNQPFTCETVPVPLPVLALINCSVATVAGSLRLAGPLAGRNVLIAGTGMLGVIACAMARAAGARRIVAVDVDAARLVTATKFGADVTIVVGESGGSLAERVAAQLQGEPVTAALDYSGVPDTMEALVGALGVGGTLVLVGATFPQRPLLLDAERLVRAVLTIRGLHNYNDANFLAAVEFIERYHAAFPFDSLVHDRFDLDQVEEAFDYAVKSGAHRVGLRTVSRTGAG